MTKSQDSIFSPKIAFIIFLGMILCAGLFYLMMKFADAGNLVYVILTALGIGFIGFFISKYIRYEQIKRI